MTAQDTTKQHGFTLVELLVVMGMLALVMTAIYSLYFTHQRAAFVQEEVVELQQNLRIGAESMSRDIKMAGFLTPLITATSSITPIKVASNGTGTIQPLPAPDNINSDSMTINTLSITASFATISTTVDPGVTLGPFTVKTASTVDLFTAGTVSTGDKVLIVGQESRAWRGGYNGGTCTSGTNPNIFYVATKSSLPPTLTLGVNTGSDLKCGYDAGDLLVKVDSTTLPSTVQYCLGPSATCGNTVTTCPTGQLCLMRIENGTANPIAQNMAGLQFRYLMDDGTEVDAPTKLCSIRAVKLKLTGQTLATKTLSNNQSKERQLETIVEIRNRTSPACGS